MPRSSQKPELLAHAAALVAHGGAAALTYDALVAASGVSKGGVLYHFPTKADLVADLLEDVLDRFSLEVDARAAASGGELGDWARGFVETAFDRELAQPELAVALLVSSVELTEDLLERCARRSAAWQDRLVDDGLSPGVARVIRYACQGWWTARSVGDGRVAGDREQLRSELLGLAAGRTWT